MATTMPSDEDYTNFMKQTLKTLCLSEKFCGLCLQSKKDLNKFSMEFVINKQKCSKCLHDILNYVFNDDIKSLISSPYICKTCTEKVVHCYTFIHNVKQMLQIIDNCVEDMTTKLDYIHNKYDTSFDLDTGVMITADNDNKDLYYSIIDTDEIEMSPIASPRIIEKEKQLTTNNCKSLKVKLYKNVGRKRKYLPTDIFPCSYCPKVFKMNKTARRHEREVHKQVWTCDLCERYFNSNRDYKAHCKAHDMTIKGPSNIEKLAISSPTSKIEVSDIRLGYTESNPQKQISKPPENVVCAYCPEIFTTNRALRIHVKVIHNKPYYECDLCKQTYTTWGYLIKHYNTIHNAEKCKFCDQIFALKEFMQHLKDKHLDLVFPCRFCDLVYYSSDSLVTHFHVSHLVNTNGAQSQCVMCLKDVNPDRLKYHRRRCRFACTECFEMPCIHHKYLVSYREQVLNKEKRIKCLDCEYTVSTKLSFIAHVNQKHLSHHPFTCDHCQQQFYSKSRMKTHIVLFHLDNRCEYCDVVFTYIDTLEEHKRQCLTKARPFGCSKCKASFDSEECLASHDALRHSENAYACEHCSCLFLDYTELEEHNEREHGGVAPKDKNELRKYVFCSLCEIQLKSIEEVNLHQKLHSPEDKFACKKCNEEFESLLKLYVHNLKHKINRTVDCKFCNIKVQASRHREHEAYCFYTSNKAKELRHVCEDCGKAFFTKSDLNRHALKHQEKKSCPQCHKKTKDIKKHIRNMHSLTKPKLKRPVTIFKCEECNLNFPASRPLEAHMNRFHLKIKPYCCSVCGQTFFSENRLNSHMITHTQEKVCYCSVCGKRYSDPVCLKRHFRSHTGDLPYICDICGEKFRTSTLMKMHRMKKHFEKTVSCPFCDNMFYVLGEMRAHFKSVHWKVKDRPFNVREVEGLSEEHYHLFEDRRFPKVD